MAKLVLRTPSVGSVLKEIMAVNPNLTAQEMIQIVKQSIETLGSSKDEFSKAEVVNQAKAVGLARAMLRS